MWNNPIILKELLEAAHRKRTYLVRAGLPAFGAAILLPQLIAVMEYAPNDWRAVSNIARPLFATTMWLEFGAFSLLALVLGASTIRGEWTRKTIEVLCASPLSAARIVYGKFFAAMGVIVVTALSLLPMTAISFRLGRVPPEMALGALAVVAGSALLFGSFSLLQASAFRPFRGTGFAAWISINLPYFLILSLLDVLERGHPWLDAAIPPVALARILDARPPAQYTTGEFAVLSLGIHVGVSIVALGLAPVFFARSFSRHIGSGGRARLFAVLKKRLRKRRPRLPQRRYPFVWQELGSRTAILRWFVWIVYGITALFFLVGGIAFNDFDFIEEEGFYVFIAFEGLLALNLAAALYGTSVFAREKARRTAAPLLLTGHHPMRFIGAKIRATYRGLRWPILGVALACIAMFVAIGDFDFDEEEFTVAVVVLELLLVAPAAAVIIGMTFSVASRSIVHSFLAFASSSLWVVAFFFVVGAFGFSLFWGNGEWIVFLVLLIVSAVVYFTARRWRPWKLSLFLALCVLGTIFAMVVGADIIIDSLWNSGPDFNVFVTAISLYIALQALVWLRICVRSFDDGLAGEVTRRRRFMRRRGARRDPRRRT